MSWVTDIRDILEKLKFAEIVDEGQVGIHLRKGKAVLHEKRYFGAELEEIIAEEKKVIADCGGISHFLNPIYNAPTFPEGYGRRKFLGLPRHPKRYIKDKNLSPGFYWCIPFVDSIYTDHNQERRIVSKIEDMVILPMADNGNVAFGFVMIQKIADYYGAYTKGDDYEDLLRGKASTISKKFAGGYTQNQWRDPQVHASIADNTLRELNSFTKERWGVEVAEFSLNPVICNPLILINYSSNPNQTGSYVGGQAGLSLPQINK
jgi:regulator of protease activity HflC (stomatin/prohibitin superfamily)